MYNRIKDFHIMYSKYREQKKERFDTLIKLTKRELVAEILKLEDELEKIRNHQA